MSLTARILRLGKQMVNMNMKRVLASELSQYVDQPVRLRGWLNNVRAIGKVNFLILRDFTGLSQIVIHDKEEWRKVSNLQPGSVLCITGKAVKSAQADLGVEVVDPIITLEVQVQEIPPVEYYKPEIHSDLEFILDNRPIALRNRQLQAVFKIQAELSHAFRLYMHNEVKAVEYFAPNIIGASSEGELNFSMWIISATPRHWRKAVNFISRLWWVSTKECSP